MARACSASPDPSSLEEGRDEQEAGGRALAGDRGHRARRSGEPAAGHGGVPLQHQDEPGPERAPPGGALVTESNVLGVRPLPGDDGLVVVAGKVGGDGQAFDVLGVELVGGGQLLVGLTPRLAFERLAASHRDHGDILADAVAMRLLREQGPREPPGADAGPRRAGRRSVAAAMRVPRSRRPAAARPAGERRRRPACVRTSSRPRRSSGSGRRRSHPSASSRSRRGVSVPDPIIIVRRRSRGR